MIRIEHVVEPAPEQMIFVIEGMRNPLNSWKYTDSFKCDRYANCDECESYSNFVCNADYDNSGAIDVGHNDKDLMIRLRNAGSEHRKFMRMMPIMMRITAGHTFWAEFDTYKVGTVRNSCSKMHKIHVAKFEVDDFDHEGIDLVGGPAVECFEKTRETLIWLCKMYNETHKKRYWRAIIELLPMGFHLTANVEINYETALNIVNQRSSHKLDEWLVMCDVLKHLRYGFLIN